MYFCEEKKAKVLVKAGSTIRRGATNYTHNHTHPQYVCRRVNYAYVPYYMADP